MKILKMACKTNSEQACRWGFKPFIWEMRLREYKSALIDKGLNYFISVETSNTCKQRFPAPVVGAVFQSDIQVQAFLVQTFLIRSVFYNFPCHLSSCIFSICLLCSAFLAHFPIFFFPITSSSLGSVVPASFLVF